jgi:cytochrome c biogenesis protein CcmG/thiol:disulfide interchange protein DsbE
VKNSLIFVAVVILAVTGLLFVSKSLVHSPANAGANSNGDRFVGAPAPDFQLAVLDTKDKTLKLSDFKGKAVVVNFWATWCEPCKVEMPWLVELKKQYGPQGLEVVGIAMDDTDPKTIAEFTQKNGCELPGGDRNGKSGRSVWRHRWHAYAVLCRPNGKSGGSRIGTTRQRGD